MMYYKAAQGSASSCGILLFDFLCERSEQRQSQSLPYSCLAALGYGAATSVRPSK